MNVLNANLNPCVSSRSYKLDKVTQTLSSVWWSV